MALHVIAPARVEGITLHPVIRVATAHLRARAVAAVGTPNPLVSALADDGQVATLVVACSQVAWTRHAIALAVDVLAEL